MLGAQGTVIHSHVIVLVRMDRSIMMSSRTGLSIVFMPHVKNEKRPLLHIMDGYKSHISTIIIRIALDHNIHIECLSPRSTTLLQPLDVVTLSKLKTAWRQLLKTYNQKTNLKPIDKPRFALLVSFNFHHVEKVYSLFLDFRII